MEEIFNNLEVLQKSIDSLSDSSDKEIMNQFNKILTSLVVKVEEVVKRQTYLEEDMGYIGEDLTDIQEELFEEVSFDELVDMETEYEEISCKNCNKPMYIEKDAINNNNRIPCPFCNKDAI